MTNFWCETLWSAAATPNMGKAERGRSYIVYVPSSPTTVVTCYIVHPSASLTTVMTCYIVHTCCSLTMVIKKFAKQLEDWISAALTNLPESLKEMKLKSELARKKSLQVTGMLMHCRIQIGQ